MAPGGRRRAGCTTSCRWRSGPGGEALAGSIHACSPRSPDSGSPAHLPLRFPRDNPAAGGSTRILARAEFASQPPVDSGGLGKGLALRWAWRTMAAKLGAGGALLEAGGDIVGRGPSPHGGSWHVGLEDPRGGAGPWRWSAWLTAQISTSSTRRHRWIDPHGRPAHHLIDPRTGQPGGEGLLAVTVAAADPAWAEVWTKMLFLGGPDRIGDEARSRGLAAWWVEADGTLQMTPAARQRTIWTALASACQLRR